MTVRLRAGVVVLLSLLGITGCTTVNPGQPAPASTTTPTVSVPQRPKDISLDQVDPCTLWTTAQQQQLKVYRFAPGPSNAAKGRTTCTFQVKDPVAYQYSVAPETKRGVDAWLGGNGTEQFRQTMVGSFPAIQLINKDAKWDAPTGLDCSTDISVAQGQELEVGVQPHGKDLSQAQMCDLSKTGAEMALATLQTIK